jgi:hypothetical protein
MPPNTETTVNSNIKNQPGQVLVAQAYNSSDSGGRDQEDHILKPARAYSSSRDPISKNSITKKKPVEWLKVKALSSNPRTTNTHTKSGRGLGM